MSYLKIIGARRKSGDLPTMRKTEMSDQQNKRAAAGLCIKCGRNAAPKESYLCPDCQALDTIDEIRDEIASLRRKILNKKQ